jgi:hypothetical protein
MLVLVGVATMGGVTYLIARPDAGTSRADLVDAGLGECTPRTLECEGRVLATCEGYSGRRMRTAVIPARECPQTDGGAPVLIVAPGKRIRECFELRGPVEEACEVVTDGGSVADEGDDAPVTPVTDRCFCRQMDAGACRYLGGVDGGLVMMGPRNIHPGPVVGPACRRAACGIFAGDSDDDALHEACR